MRLDRKALAELLPAIHRIRDREEGEPLLRLISVIAEQLEVLDDSVDQLYDDQFIETCAEWVVPYIGDLVGARGIRDVDATGFSARSYIANTLAYRRRKGTASMLEQLARDVTGWNAAVVEYFLRLIWTQWLNHIRLDAVEWLDLRDVEGLERLRTPFERAMRTVDVRRISSGRGLHNIPNIGIFLWRIAAYSVTASPAHRVQAGDPKQWTFSPLGNDMPLYSHPVTEEEITHLATLENVPMPISRRELARNVARWYGDGASILVRLGGVPVAPTFVRVCDLSGLPGAWAHTPAAAGAISIDPMLGRLALPAAPATIQVQEEPAPKVTLTADPMHKFRYTSASPFPAKLEKLKVFVGGVQVDPARMRASASNTAVDDALLVDLANSAIVFPAVPSQPLVTWHYGAAGDVGGGEYERQASFGDIDETPVNPGSATIDATIDGFGTKDGIVELPDSGRYEETLTISLGAGQRVELRAANDARPAVILTTDATITAGAGAELTLNGLLIAGGALHVSGDLRLLRIRHCTLVPGIALHHDNTPAQPNAASLVITTTSPIAVEIESSILGPIDMPAGAGTLTIRDSIVDARGGVLPAIGASTGSGPPATIERSTIFGRVAVRELTLASESIFTAVVTAERTQAGCVRFSFVPPGSTTPRRYKCQPVSSNVIVAFVSERYADAAYAQLSPSTHIAVTNGAESGSEMGVYCALEAPRREINLRAVLDEYLRFGLEAGIFHAS